MFPSETPVFWCAELPAGRLSTGCAGELAAVSGGMASGTGTRGTASARTGFSPAATVLFAELFVEGALAAIVVFPVCADELEGKAVAGVAL